MLESITISFTGDSNMSVNIMQPFRFTKPRRFHPAGFIFNLPVPSILSVNAYI